MSGFNFNSEGMRDFAPGGPAYDDGATQRAKAEAAQKEGGPGPDQILYVIDLGQYAEEDRDEAARQILAAAESNPSERAERKGDKVVIYREGVQGRNVK